MADSASPTNPDAPTPPLERAADPVADNPNPEIVAEPVPEPARAEADDAPAPPARSQREERMKAIADKLKAKRAGEDGADATGDYTDPVQTYGNMARPRAEEPVPEPQPIGEAPAPAPATGEPPRKIKVRVRHEERELTEAELVAHAQKSLAADSYFEDGKKYFEQGKEFLETAQRAPASRPHQDARSAQDDADLVPEPNAADPHQGDDFEKLIEEIQIGDSKQAAGKLRSAVTQAVKQGSQQALIDQRINEDHANTMSLAQKFRSENPDLANDPYAEAVIKQGIAEAYREDLLGLGVPADKLPTDPNMLANAHRLARVTGHKLRTPEEVLVAAKDGFQKWRGITPSPNPSPAPRDTQPRVVVDRTERRQAIPTQPTRSTAPPQQAPDAAPKQRTRSVAIDQLRVSRGQASRLR